MKKIQPAFVDFPNFAQDFGFANKGAISEASEFLTTRWDFARAMTQGCFLQLLDYQFGSNIC